MNLREIKKDIDYVLSQSALHFASTTRKAGA